MFRTLTDRWAPRLGFLLNRPDQEFLAEETSRRRRGARRMKLKETTTYSKHDVELAKKRR